MKGVISHQTTSEKYEVLMKIRRMKKDHWERRWKTSVL
jgi:hypothetical protein